MKVWKYGDSINTDMLFPGKYTYTCSKAEEIKPHLLEDLDPNFANGVQTGDVIMAGNNFGCGSSREQPVLGFKAVGISAIVARSFARIFYRAAINQGMALIECADAVDAYSDGVELVLEAPGTLRIGDKAFAYPQLPKEVLAIQEAGGLLNYTREKCMKNEGN